MSGFNNNRHLENPLEFVKQFKSIEQFKGWARNGIIRDCRIAIEVYSKLGMTLHCNALQEVIDERVDTMLSGLGFVID